jgi:hypothetical protein
MKFTQCSKDSFENEELVIEKLEKEYSKKSELIICVNVSVKSNSESELARDLASANVNVYQIKNLFFIFEYNGSLSELALMFKSVLSTEEMKEFEEIKSTYDYVKAVEFLSKNTF